MPGRMMRKSSPCGWYWNGDKRNGQRDSHRLWIRIRGAGHSDVNGDGVVNKDDYNTIIQPLIGTGIGDPAYVVEADLDRDGKITSDDYDVCIADDGQKSSGGVGEAGLFSAGVRNSVGYCGYIHNEDTGLYTVRYRTYSAVLGRWLTRDPAGYVDGMALYEYVQSAPQATQDPSGLSGQVDPPKPGSATVRDLTRFAQQSECTIEEGGKHTKVLRGGKQITTTPRSNPVAKGTAKGIIRAILGGGAAGAGGRAAGGFVTASALGVTTCAAGAAIVGVIIYETETQNLQKGIDQAANDARNRLIGASWRMGLKRGQELASSVGSEVNCPSQDARNAVQECLDTFARQLAWAAHRVNLIVIDQGGAAAVQAAKCRELARIEEYISELADCVSAAGCTIGQQTCVKKSPCKDKK
jgi:RHS repeat-associated protein